MMNVKQTLEFAFNGRHPPVKDESQGDVEEREDRLRKTSLLLEKKEEEVIVWSKYPHYDLQVDPDEQDDKAREILVCSFRRPHMRAFHCAWWGLFVAFFVWFSIAPLLTDIRDDLGLTNAEIWTSSIASVAGTIVVRCLVGPLCDWYGARVIVAVLLCCAAIPTACTGLVQTANGLALLRLCIGIAGGTFVACQYWTSRMFTKEVVGTANALVAGWGNLGAGVTQIVFGSMLLPLFEAFTGGDSEMAWRTVCIVPACLALVTAVLVYRFSDDAPKGNYTELKQHGQFPNADMRLTTAWWQACGNLNTWMLAVQYAACFGVELTMNNAAALYFRDEFGQSREAAAAMAAIFGWLNLFGRGLGGVASDALHFEYGMPGRLWLQTILLIVEGGLIFVFSHSHTLAGSIAILVVFSLFVQAAEGTSYAIVPYVNPKYMGTVAGIVGAGGNVGAVGFGLAFRELPYQEAFNIMGGAVLLSSLLSLFLVIKGYRGMLWGKDRLVDKETGEIVNRREKLQLGSDSAHRKTATKKDDEPCA